MAKREKGKPVSFYSRREVKNHLFINTFRYAPEDVDCKLCTEYRGADSPCMRCPYMRERIEAGAVDYTQVVHECFPHRSSKSSLRAYRWDRHIRSAIRGFSGSMYLNQRHRERMEEISRRTGIRQKRDTPAYFAVLYLLTSNEEIFSRCSNCFCRYGVELDYATVKGISSRDYMILSTAKDIYADRCSIVLKDLADGEITDNETFGLLMNALLIARYGSAVLRVRERRTV